MANRKPDLSIPWPFAPTVVKLNNDTNLLKVIAMIAMLCDHAGKMLFPQYRIMRIIGRMAFPIYAYCLAVGCVYTKNPLRYLGRIVLLALVSQPIYAVSMGHSTPSMYALSFTEQPIRAALNFYIESWTKKPSILVALALGMLLIWTLRERKLVFTAALAVFIWLVQNKLDYGVKGVMLIVLFYLFMDKPLVSFVAVFLFMWYWGMPGYFTRGSLSSSIQLYALYALPLIYLPLRKRRVCLPKTFFYAFYPGHLMLIYLLLRVPGPIQILERMLR